MLCDCYSILQIKFFVLFYCFNTYVKKYFISLMKIEAKLSSRRIFNEIHFDTDPNLTIGFGHFASDTLNGLFEKMDDKTFLEMKNYVINKLLMFRTCKSL